MSGTWSGASAKFACKAAVQILQQKQRITVTGNNLEAFLGVRKFLPDQLPCDDRWSGNEWPGPAAKAAMMM